MLCLDYGMTAEPAAVDTTPNERFPAEARP